MCVECMYHCQRTFVHAMHNMTIPASDSVFMRHTAAHCSASHVSPRDDGFVRCLFCHQSVEKQSVET